MTTNSPLVRAERATPALAPNHFLGRQPILDAKRQIFGYELLFRTSETSDSFSGDPEQATREVVDHWLLLIPSQNATVAFVNATRTAVMDGVVTLLPGESTVIEIPLNVYPDPDFVDACVRLKQSGYRFAVDGFFPDPARAAFLDFADFIKIDFQNCEFQLRRKIYAMAAGRKIRIVAEKIETEVQMRMALAEGCSLFQGFFFSQPVLVSSHVVPQNHMVYLRLMAELNRNPVDLFAIEKLIMGEPSLCYRLLRISNSALYGRRSTVTTVREALMMVGENAVRRMITAAMAGVLGSQRSPAVVSMALSRARFCELLAPRIAQDPAQMYLLGILSLLDVLLETSMEAVLNALPVSSEMKSALFGDSSAAGRTLELARGLESCDWERCDQLQYSLGLGEGVIAPIYVESLSWAASTLAE